MCIVESGGHGGRCAVIHLDCGIGSGIAHMGAFQYIDIITIQPLIGQFTQGI